MDKLLSDLEQATEGSHELNARIYKIWRKTAPPPKLGGIWTSDLEYVPSYTTSLDAALMLVPKGCGWMLESCGTASVHSLASKPGQIGFPIIGEGQASTPALALVIAALRARQEERKSPDR